MRYNKNKNKLIEKRVNKNTILKEYLGLKNGVFESMSEDLGGDNG
jgi:hypothetical protein